MRSAITRGSSTNQSPLVATSIERLFLSRLLSGYGEKECLRWETSRTSCRHASWCILGMSLSFSELPYED